MNSTVERVEVHFTAPKAVEDVRGIGLYLMEVGIMPPASTARLPPLQVALRYLVTSSAEDPEGAHRLLGELMFAAMENPEFQVELESVPMAVWTAFGIPPRPSFVLRVPLQQVRAETRAKPVRAIPVVKTMAVAPLHGIVWGPNDTPVSGAEVHAPALRLTTHTDYHGRFLFSMVPGEGQKITLRVKAKSREMSVSTDRNYPDATKPFLIRFDTLED